MTSEALKTATEGTGDEDLGVILRQMHLKHPEMSAEKVRASILEEHPDWKVSVKVSSNVPSSESTLAQYLL